MRTTRRDLIRAGALLPLALPLGAFAPVQGFDWLIGEWVGEGRFMGGPSKAELDARLAVDERFLEILWRVAAGGSRVPYEGRGLYRLTKTGWDGYWFDNSNAIRPLTATAEPNAFRVAWGTAETERGTSSYTLTGDTLTVADIVLTAQGPRPIATHLLKRRA